MDVSSVKCRTEVSDSESNTEEDVSTSQTDLHVGIHCDSHSVTNSGITWYKATFLVVNAALGAGLLNFPRAFSEAGGILSGNLVHIIFTLFAFGSLVIIGRCAHKNNCKTYQEVVLHMCNPTWSIISSVCITIYCFITCITFIIIIGDQFDRAFASFAGPDFCHHWFMNRKFTMMTASLFLIFPSCFKHMDGLRFMSYIGVLSIWYLTIVIVIEMFSNSYSKGPVIIWDMHFTKVFDVVPTICFGYQCHVSSIPIYSCLQDKTVSTFLKAVAVAILVCFCVYTLSANCGYLTFGSLVEGDVLLSYDAKKPYVLAAVILLALKSWSTYPILLFCVREAIGDVYVFWQQYTPIEAAQSEPLRRRVLAFLLWLSSVAFAVFAPNINIVVNLLGSLAAIFIFVFPGICQMQFCFQSSVLPEQFYRLKDMVLLIIALLYIIVGMFTFGLAFTLGLKDILHPEATVPLCT